MESVAGPQLLGVCCSYGGLGRETCAGKGVLVGVGGTVGCEVTGCKVRVGAVVGVVGKGVTGKAVGTGPGGLTTFFA